MNFEDFRKESEAFDVKHVAEFWNVMKVLSTFWMLHQKVKQIEKIKLQNHKNFLMKTSPEKWKHICAHQQSSIHSKPEKRSFHNVEK